MLKYYNFDIVFQEIPNEVTLAVNITNCPNRCKGCHSTHLQEDIGIELNEKEILNLLDQYASVITCFCFMGGDRNPQRVASLANYIRIFYPGLKIAWYSGCSHLPDGFNKNVFEYIKLGAYKEQLGNLKSETSNQALFAIQKDGKMKDVTHLFRQT